METNHFDMYSLEGAAAALGISPKGVGLLIAHGKLRALVPQRGAVLVPRASVEEYKRVVTAHARARAARRAQIAAELQALPTKAHILAWATAHGIPTGARGQPGPSWTRARLIRVITALAPIDPVFTG